MAPCKLWQHYRSKLLYLLPGSIVVRASGWHSGDPGLILGRFSANVLFRSLLVRWMPFSKSLDLQDMYVYMSLWWRKPWLDYTPPSSERWIRGAQQHPWWSGLTGWGGGGHLDLTIHLVDGELETSSPITLSSSPSSGESAVDKVGRLQPDIDIWI